MSDKPKNVSDLYEEEPKAAPETEAEEEPGSLELKAEEEDEGGKDDGGDIPAWVREYLPSDFRIPRGAEVMFVRFRSRLTAAPDQGVMTLYPKRVLTGPGQFKIVQREELTRVLVLWPITDAEEKMALKRSGRDAAAAGRSAAAGKHAGRAGSTPAGREARRQGGKHAGKAPQFPAAELKGLQGPP